MTAATAPGPRCAPSRVHTNYKMTLRFLAQPRARAVAVELPAVRLRQMPAAIWGEREARQSAPSRREARAPQPHLRP